MLRLVGTEELSVVASRTKFAKARIEKSNLPKGAIKAGYPGFVARASLRSSPPAGANWLHEIKFDGYRLHSGLVTLPNGKPGATD